MPPVPSPLPSEPPEAELTWNGDPTRTVSLAALRRSLDSLASIAVVGPDDRRPHPNIPAPAARPGLPGLGGPIASQR